MSSGNVLEGPKPLSDSSPMVARINGVQTVVSALILVPRQDEREQRHTRSRADDARLSVIFDWSGGIDLLDSDTSFLYNLIRESSRESDDSSLGRGVIKELGIS
jgi:hypothetical protein